MPDSSRPWPYYLDPASGAMTPIPESEVVIFNGRRTFNVVLDGEFQENENGDAVVLVRDGRLAIFPAGHGWGFNLVVEYEEAANA